MMCPVCNERNPVLWGKAGSYEILKCTGCGLGMTSPLPSAEELAKINRETYQVEQRISTYLGRQGYFEKRYRRYLKTIKSFKSGGRLLDVGCNLGLFLKVARSEGFDVAGVELNRECADYGRKHFGLDIRSEYLETLAFPSRTFDVITLFDVVEHVPDLHGFMAEVTRILKEDGLLVLQMPNFDSVMASLTRSGWHWLTPPDHLYHFTPRAVERFVAARGFRVEKIGTWEPAEDFSTNILSTYKSRSLLGRLLFKLNQVSKVITLFVLLTRRLWWQRGRGGLLEVYATGPGYGK